MPLPAGLPGYEVYNLTEAYNLDNIDIGESMTLRIPSLQLQLRTHEFYMGMWLCYLSDLTTQSLLDMSLNVDLISGHVQHHCSEKLWPVDSKEWNKAEAFVIDSGFILSSA